jgi:hypothetical protein
MTRNMRRQALTVGALTATLIGVNSGIAVGVPPTDGPAVRSSITTASVFLIGPDVFSHINVFAPEGEEPFARGDIFVAGYDCVTEDAAAATIDDLDSATSTGRLEYLCSTPDVSDMAAYATIDLAWTGKGEVSRLTSAGPLNACTEHLEIRHAHVSGSIRIFIPELGIDQMASAPGDDDDSLVQREAICPPGRN